MENNSFGMGWLKDYPDIRDYHVDYDTVSEKMKNNGQNDSVKTMLKKLNMPKKIPVKAPASADIRAWCSPVENQGGLGSCTANAAAGIIEYYERRAFGKYIDASRLFIYKTTRDLLGWTGDTGAYLRSTMGSLALFGAAQEKYWPYVISHFDIEPSAFLYAMAKDYQALVYYRLDPLGTPTSTTLDSIKLHILAGIPSMFGFTCYSSLWSAVGGKIPFPQSGEHVIGGHAVDVVGFDDSLVITNGSVRTTGALLIRNSWGPTWGISGYGYLPYEYVLRGLANDFWVLISNAWVDSGKFGI